ncbi:MAG TPA: hypothetical protein PLG32_00920 [Piscinibacter sp.]|nr:hypothetical protein [Piscinibacter sp.]
MKRHLAIFALALLAGCDMLGIESPEKVAATREADGKAVGGACRHAGRAIEDCYALNKKADRAAVFAGWRDMNDYMRENKIEEVPPQIAGVAAKPAAEEAADTHVEKRPAKGSESKAKDKPKARES